MNIDIEKIPNQDIKTFISSLELVSARIFESVVTLNQTACTNTPEMQNMFQEWISCLGEEIVREVTQCSKIDLEKIAKNIGVSTATIISLALTLHRQGRIKINSLEAEIADCTNQEIRDCFKSE